MKIINRYMIALLNNIKILIFKTFIKLIKVLEYFIIYKDEKSYDISKFGYFVNIDSELESKITHIHYTGLKPLYELTTYDGKKLQATQEHILPIYHTSEALISNDKYFSIGDLKHKIYLQTISKYCIINADGFYERIESIEKMSGLHRVFDITISDKVHIFIANGIKVHNCVTADTDIEILNKETSEFNYIPIFELYYSNMKTKNWLMKFEYWLTKTIYKINNKKS